MAKCKQCRGDSDGRSFCKPDCYLIYPDGRERKERKEMTMLSHHKEMH